jgi:maltooligosyltrehalose trehalohydrolase
MATHPDRHAHAGPFGAHAQPGGGVEFRFWAPKASSVDLVLRQGGKDDRVVPVGGDAAGWHVLFLPSAEAGTRYRWRIDGDLQVPDPASRFNPEGVHGFSEVIDPRHFPWTDAAWTGRPWHEAVMYELHVGAFTPEGTCAAAQARLPALAALGVTALQLMPLADFPGRFGWGYDGVLPYAPQAAYGRPDDLKRFVQAAHGLGMMVLLDVVYNHFGPDGNHLSAYAPAFFSDTHHTAWGAAVNFDGPGSADVREFFVHNALHWLDEYRFDGLRFDAVHAMIDDSRPDIMQALSARVREAFPGRHVHLVLENDSNDPARLAAPATPGRFEGQWNGDFHHPLHVLLTGEGDGYYGEYVDDTLGQLARSLTHGLVWQGGPHNSEHAPPRRRADGPVPLGCMVNFLQNHDQVGNRAFGERLLGLVPDEAPMRLATALLLLHPGVPMLFMGEEWGATTPFLYFCDWQGELKRAVTEGRRREFAQFPRFADPAIRDRIPDPCSPDSLQRSRLDPAAQERPEAVRWRGFHAQLLGLRHADLVPRLPELAAEGHASERLGPRALWARWDFQGGRSLQVAFNLGPDPVPDLPAGLRPAGPAWFALGDAGPEGLGPWSAAWWWNTGGGPETLP